MRRTTPKDDAWMKGRFTGGGWLLKGDIPARKSAGEDCCEAPLKIKQMAAR
jgi:hypothetical protein